MLTKLKELSTQMKVAIAAGIVALAAVGIGVAVWQPWNQPEEPSQPPDAVQQDPAVPQTPQEKDLSVRVNSEDVPCTLYEGTGWSIYVPEGWETARQGENGALFTSPDGAELEVAFVPVDGGTGLFGAASAGQDGRQLQFCNGGGEGSPLVTGRAAEAQWNRYEKLFTALAKTLTVGTDTPLAGNYTVPQKPDWQTADGYTVLFLGKDGVILDDMVQKAVEDYMRSWPEEDRTLYTGQYRVNGIDWAASYTGLTDGYIDVFRARVQYRIAADALEEVQAREGVAVADGWASLPESVHLVLTHDGDDIEKDQTVVAPVSEDWIGFTELLG